MNSIAVVAFANAAEILEAAGKQKRNGKMVPTEKKSKGSLRLVLQLARDSFSRASVQSRATATEQTGLLGDFLGTLPEFSVLLLEQI